MKYHEMQSKLCDALKPDSDVIDFEDKVIRKYPFQSKSVSILPGNESNSRCNIHDIELHSEFKFSNDLGNLVDLFQADDSKVGQNSKFDYFILYPNKNKKSDKITFLLHGFNEKNWDKYLAWGNEICERTNSAVVFFPIAFHMQRAPFAWSAKKEMYDLCSLRKDRYPYVVDSSLINVASSMRLHHMPQRFIWSGLQSYYDFIQIIEELKDSRNSHIDANFTFNIFAYSIGGLVAEILKLSNHNNYFENTKVCLFCSGAVFNRMSAVSKFILDSEASVALYSFLVEHLDVFIKHDPLLNHYFDGKHVEGNVFHSMLRYDYNREFREDLFRKWSNNFYAIALKNDTVISPVEIINTLKGPERNIEIPVEVLDFPFKYSHETPFPINSNINEQVDACFKQVFSKACDFLL